MASSPSHPQLNMLQRFDERTRQYPPLDEPMRKDASLGRGIPLPAPRESDFGRWYGAPYEADLEELPTVRLEHGFLAVNSKGFDLP